MHRTSTASQAIGTILTVAGAMTLTALTDTGAGGAYAFLFLGLAIFITFMIWPERTRFRRRSFGSDSHGRQAGRQSR
jgi:hypothetical protein